MLNFAKRAAIILILIPSIQLFPSDTVKAATPFQDISATSALLAEANTGEILFEHNMRLRQPADTLAKIMTLLLATAAIENKEFTENDILEMTETALLDIEPGYTTQNIRQGEEMTLLDLMYSAFTGGSSEACNLIAEHIGGSVDEFIEMMNARAVELGCTNTHFTSAHGQSSDDHYTTARDQFLIFSEAMNNPLFAEITGVYRHTTEATNLSEPRRLSNTNSMLNTNGKYYFTHCTSGIVTNLYFDEIDHLSKRSFVAFAESEGLSLVAIVFGATDKLNEDESVDMRNLTEAKRLFEWGFSQYGWRVILSSIDIVEKVPVQHGAGADFVNVSPESEVRLLLDKNIPLEAFRRDVIIYSIVNDEPLVAPVSAGDVLGEVTLTRDGVEYGPILLVANTNVDLHSFEFIRMQIVELLSGKTARYVMWALGILVAGYIALVVRYNVIRRKRIQRIKAARRKLADERQGHIRHNGD